MANIKIELGYPLEDGMSLTFKAPCDGTAVTGLKVYYPKITDSGSTTVNKIFSFRDAHLNALASLDNLFMSGATLKVVLDTTNSYAFIQNADTNGYVEGKFDQKLSLSGGTLTDNVVFPAAKGIATNLNGNIVNTIARSANNNIWVGADDVDAGADGQGNVFLGMGANGNAYVKRYGASSATKILDYGFVCKELWSGSLTVGSKVTISDISNYTEFLMYAGSNTTPFHLVRNGTRISGGGKYSTPTNMWESAISFTISGDTITFSSFSQIPFSMGNGTVGTITDSITITKIIGLI